MYRSTHVSGNKSTELGSEQCLLAIGRKTSSLSPITSATAQSYFSSENLQPVTKTLHFVDSLNKCTYSLEFSPSAILSRQVVDPSRGQIPSKKWWFLLSALFPRWAHRQWWRSPNLGAGSLAGVRGQGSFPQSGCAWGSCVQCGLTQQRRRGRALGRLLPERPHVSSSLLVLCLLSLRPLPVDGVDSWWVWPRISPIFFFCQPSKGVFYSS